MADFKNQAFWEPGGSTLRLPPALRLANVDKERLWKGLERFVNCGDSIRDFHDLGRAFPGFWPVGIQYKPDSNEVFGRPLAWHTACHGLFRCYRDALRDVWKGITGPWHVPANFLLGLTDLNKVAFKPRKSDKYRLVFDSLLCNLRPAWREIHREFATAAPTGNVSVGMLWERGEFYLDLSDAGGNEFVKAFYLLFRQSWRARVCPRCKVFFVALGPKQTFCGTSCSAGSRNASKLKWWRSVGEQRRARHREKSLKRDIGERKGR